MASKRFLTLLSLAALCLLVPRPVTADVIANSMLSFSNLSITPSSGLLTLDDVWLLQTFASANNSLGQSDSQFNFAFSPGTTSATAAVTWATATGTATAPGGPPNLNVSASAMSSVNIPGCNAVAAFADSFGNLSNTFTVSGTGAVAVQFGVDISGTLNVMTDACGLNALTQTIFSLEVDGNPVLFDFRFLNIGPSSALMDSFSVHLTTTFLLDAGVPHFLLLQADSESQGLIPEPASIALLLVAFGVMLLTNRRRDR